MLDHPVMANRMAAARVLGRIDGEETSERLIAMVLDDFNRREALLALVASTGEEAAAFLARAEQDISLAAAVHAAEQQFRSFSVTTARYLQ
jgi:hypothetical protein